MIVVFSPHCDDAIFSIGTHLSALEDVLIVSPMAGVPNDVIGQHKYELIHAEHHDACKLVGAAYRNGPFLDDVYPTSKAGDVQRWLAEFVDQADTIYAPLGIHHPDHIRVSNLLLYTIEAQGFAGRVFFYEELPYRIDYPNEAVSRREFIAAELRRSLAAAYGAIGDALKRSACLAYTSQTNHYGTTRLDEELLGKLMSTERVWELA